MLLLWCPVFSNSFLISSPEMLLSVKTDQSLWCFVIIAAAVLFHFWCLSSTRAEAKGPSHTICPELKQTTISWKSFTLLLCSESHFNVKTKKKVCDIYFYFNNNLNVWQWNSVCSPVFADTDAVESVSVTEGESVSLNSGLTGTQTRDIITWSFGYPETRIAIINREEGIVSTSEGDAVGFRDRLKLDHQTGSLTITNTRTTDSGNYTVNIKTDTKQTTYRFNVTVYGESGLHVYSHCLKCISKTKHNASFHWSSRSKFKNTNGALTRMNANTFKYKTISSLFMLVWLVWYFHKLWKVQCVCCLSLYNTSIKDFTNTSFCLLEMKSWILFWLNLG